MAARRASDLFVECLEAEGVRHVFGIPGEETLDLNESLERSSVEFVPVRHEQGGALIADVHGRLARRAGVCLGTLGPGATNLVTGVADAFLDHAPLVVLTGQGDLERMHKESHQYIDAISLMRPITKWNARLTNARIIPEVVRKAFKVAQGQKPGPTHVELPEDVMAAEVEASPLPVRTAVRRPAPSSDELEAAAEVIDDAQAPILLVGNGASRVGATGSLRRFSHATGIPVAETFMAKGSVDADDPLAVGTVGLQSRDYAYAGFEDADVVITVGWDMVEHSPREWNPDGDKRIVCLDTTPVEVDEHFVTAADVIGDLAYALDGLTELCADGREGEVPSRLNDVVRGRFDAAADDDRFPMQPPRVLYELRQAMGREDVLVSDVGLHKLWVGRMFPAHEPDTVLIANGLAGMGFAVPAAIGAKLAYRDRNVVAVSGDGGFLMNCQELETAKRLGTAFVTVIWEDHRYGSIAWKQERRFGRHFGTDFDNPDFVKLAESFGLPASRCESVDDFPRQLRHALGLDLASVIVLPIDYSIDVAISEELGAETIPT
ncbi:MAG: acetolactate synthase large subunit [Actinomycetota bacterium]|nr:acetolactate synthase large subunit [Actinomycetota bacterium]